MDFELDLQEVEQLLSDRMGKEEISQTAVEIQQREITEGRKR